VDFLSTQQAVLFVGVLLLLLPGIGGAFAPIVSALAGRIHDRRDFEKRTVAEILDLRDRCAKHGNPKAERICRELLLAVIYGDGPRDQH
jgi:hypothetical protein